jgi:hypothetical protein
MYVSSDFYNRAIASVPVFVQVCPEWHDRCTSARIHSPDSAHLPEDRRAGGI